MGDSAQFGMEDYYDPREIPRPAGESAGLRDDAAQEIQSETLPARTAGFGGLLTNRGQTGLS